VTQRDKMASAKANWDTAKLTTAKGLLNRSAVEVSRRVQFLANLELAHLDLTADNLVWSLPPSRQSEDTIMFDFAFCPPEPGDGTMLDHFVRLHKGLDRDILEFARKWGVLQLCHHNLPYTHGASPLGRDCRLKLPPWMTSEVVTRQWSIKWKDRQDAILHRYYGIESQGCFRLHWEPLETWRFFSKQACALLDIAAKVHCGKPGTADDWGLVLKGRFPGHAESDALRLTKVFLVEALNIWLDLGAISLDVVDIKGRTRRTGADLFGSIALQLMLAATRQAGLALCAACGEEYPPTRRPSEGRQNYCNKKGCQREASRRRKASQRAQIRKKSKRG